MIDLIKKFFARVEKNESKERHRERPHDARIATCALLLEMANIDGEFSASERESMITILKANYHIPDEYIDQIIKAANEELKQSVDLWRFTNLINQNYSVEEKRRIIEMVWEIAYRDGRLDKHEDYLMHKLAKLLHLTHKQLIQAKMKVIHGDTEA
jgi:uncharacterized tellurite resistance protein B-like protein